MSDNGLILILFFHIVILKALIHTLKSLSKHLWSEGCSFVWTGLTITCKDSVFFRVMEKTGVCSDTKDKESNIKALACFLLLNPDSCKDVSSFIEEYIWEFGVSVVLRIQSYFFKMKEKFLPWRNSGSQMPSSVAEQSTVWGEYGWSSLALRSRFIIFNAVTITRFRLSVVTYLGGTAVLSKGSWCFAEQKEIIYFHMLRWTWITKQQRKQCETNLVLHGLLDMMRTIMCYIYKQYSLISEWLLQLKSTFTSSSFLFSFLYCAVKLSMDMANNPAK